MKKLYLLFLALFMSMTNPVFSLSFSKLPIPKNTATIGDLQTFTPVGSYSGQGLVGNYFEKSGIAKIFDPSGKNSKTYTFEQVKESGITPIKGLDLIGTMNARSNCKSNACSAVARQTNLYGILQSSQNQK